MRLMQQITYSYVCFLLAIHSGYAADSPTNEQLEFFETRIRPVLVEQCYSCHNSSKEADGSLELDHRAGLLKGGDGGEIVVPGNPQASRLLAILRHEVPGTKMPQAGAKLDKSVIADFEKWIAMGAADPRDTPPTADEIAKATSWETVLEKRKQWWSLQPVRNVEPPVATGNSWSDHPVDRFILVKLHEKDLQPNEKADPRTLVRRVYFALIGLPPNADESERWAIRVTEPNGFAELVDHLLSSPHYGERWARHWMDWTRYADSHGSEGDPEIDHGWLYRDYLIRALNADVPYDQMVREHIAGDLLEHPRINSQQGINESLIGTAHWRMVFHGFSPTDALDEKTRFIDDQVNVFSKAFLGLTVSCARCHDHKFDAIGQKDYYALFGILSSCRPGRTAIDVQEKLDMNRARLAELKPQIKAAIAKVWLKSNTALIEKLLAEKAEPKKKDSGKSVMQSWSLFRSDIDDGMSVAEAWQERVKEWNDERIDRSAHEQRDSLRRWRFDNAEDLSEWTRTGSGLSDERPAAAGEFAIASQGNTALVGIYPSGVYSHRLTAKHAARLTSGDVPIDGEYDLWLCAIGDNAASTRFVVHDYPRRGVVFPTTDLKNQWQWIKFDMSYWSGDRMHVELTTGSDAPVLVKNQSRSWFGVREVMILPNGESPPHESNEMLDPWFQVAEKEPPKSLDDAAHQLAASIEAAIQAWLANTMTDAQAYLLDACLKQGLIPNELDAMEDAKTIVTEYRELEEAIPVPTRVPCLEETIARTQSIYIRGDHKHPGDDVSRGFLSAINDKPYSTKQSGRLELAEDVLRADNPLTRRVIVNRLWHHLFGRGIVPSPDNFGRLGQTPTHPELLDHLASRFQSQGGSIKAMIRFLVTSKTWQLASHPSPQALQVDPDNQLLSHAHVRRLEAEAIRDSLLSVSGSVDLGMFGEPVNGNSKRRSVYIRVTRNALDPFLRAFDFPEPFSAVGRRDVTNVPAQSLTMMNDEQIASLASAWAKRVLQMNLVTDEDRIRSMFVDALGRPALAEEIHRAQNYLVETASKYADAAKQLTELQQKIDEQRSAIDQLIEPMRSRLFADSKTKTVSMEKIPPKPIGRWLFGDSLQDAMGSADAEVKGGAHVEDGALILNKLGYAVTSPLKQTLKEKTLEVWVQLDTLAQKAGGVMTIQSSDGAAFDSIVFAEKSPNQWLAGSNNFSRTQAFDGPEETEAANRVVHVAIAYHSDGQIVGYRDGEIYGKPYQSDGPYEFKAEKTVVSFGVRHLPAGKGRMLEGSIIRAELYDRALTAAEIKASSGSITPFVSEAQIAAALTEAERRRLDADRIELAKWEAEFKELRQVSEPSDDHPQWTDLARAIFTFKEFLFVK